MRKSSADKSIFDKDALKQWLTLSELTERWTRLAGQAITEHDVLHFDRSRKLALGVITEYRWIITATEQDAYGNPVPEGCELTLFLNPAVSIRALGLGLAIRHLRILLFHKLFFAVSREPHGLLGFT